MHKKKKIGRVLEGFCLVGNLGMAMEESVKRRGSDPLRGVSSLMCTFDKSRWNQA